MSLTVYTIKWKLCHDIILIIFIHVLEELCDDIIIIEHNITISPVLYR